MPLIEIVQLVFRRVSSLGGTTVSERSEGLGAVTEKGVVILILMIEVERRVSWLEGV